MAAKNIPILMYHHVTPSPGLVSISPENFRSQMQVLADKGYRPAGLSVVEDFFQGKPVADKTVVITFDDGYLDNYIYAYPILREFGFKAVVFLVTGWVGDGGVRESFSSIVPTHRECMKAIHDNNADSVILRWSEIDKMRQELAIEFYSHTHTHIRYDLIHQEPSTAAKLLEGDLLLSRELLESRLKLPQRHLCWPQGYYCQDYVEIAKKSGFAYMYTTNRGSLGAATSKEGIPRIVAKDKKGGWLVRRLAIYGSPIMSKIYSKIHG